MTSQIETFYGVASEATSYLLTETDDDKSLVTDLGIAGQDGWQLIDALNMAFTIDWDVFDPYEFFGPELGFNPVYFIKYYWSGKYKRDTEFAKKVTVGHLKAVCISGAWFDPA